MSASNVYISLPKAEPLALHVGDRSLKVAEYYERRLDRAQRQHLAAIKSLAVVRRLALAVIQSNLAERQVNVGQVRPAASAGPRLGSEVDRS